MMTMEVLDMSRSCNFIEIPPLDLRTRLGLSCCHKESCSLGCPINATNVHVVWPNIYHRASMPIISQNISPSNQAQGRIMVSKHLKVLVVF